MATFERECLARLTPCFRTTLPQVASHIAVIHAELLLIHPFREGNGRLARWLADLLSLQRDFPSRVTVCPGQAQNPGSSNI